MGHLRRWALWVAVLAILLALLVCIGSGFFISAPQLGDRIATLVSDPSSLPNGLSMENLTEFSAEGFDADAADPPGLGIPSLALVNGLLLLVVELMVLPLLIGNRLGALVTGIASLIGGLMSLIAGVALVIVAFAKLLLMVTLFLAAPFGTLAYLAVFGFFDVFTSAAVLGLVMFLQLAAIVFVVVAQPKFLGNKRLLFFLLLPGLLTFITMLLHSITPTILVSITDAIAAIITGIVGALWGLAMLIGGLIALAKQLNLSGQGGGTSVSREAGDTAVASSGPLSAQPSGGVKTRTAQS